MNDLSNVDVKKTSTSNYHDNSVQEKHLYRRKTLMIEEHTKIFASMCPDEILDHYDDYETRIYHTTVMIGDVSGFTDLTEKYTKLGKGGPSKLTETLNSYIGAMIQEILSKKGDVLKYSGDAFIVMWKLEENMVMNDIAERAIQTACIIQKYYGTLQTDVDVTLKVKLSIASGKTYFTSIGNPNNMSYYIITGKPVWDVKYAQGLCHGGDILVTPSCWKWVNPNEYVFEILPDGKHTLILATAMMWDYNKNMVDSDDNIEKFDDHNDNSTSVTSFESLSVIKDATLTHFPKQFLKDKRFEVDYSLRSKVTQASKAQLKDALKSYISRPVVRAVEMGEPIHYLTEMRQVVIVFVNVITANINRKSLIQLVDEAYQLICKIVGDVQGCVNKTSLFDKDLMFLCIFGLRGDSQDLESQISLRCASKIRSVLIKMENIMSVSVSVTTGMTYCGVVGHIMRREYTVIGKAVNKAARLMCAYTDKVSCDKETFLQSHMESRHFVLQEPKTLKGITNVGPVYEFNEQTQFVGADLTISKYPLLGRDAEMMIFQRMLNNILETRKIRKQKKDARTVYNTLFVKSEPRLGKTRFLDELTQIIPTNVPFNYISLMLNDYEEPYSLIRLIFCVPLGIVTNSTFKERQNKLTSHLLKYDQTEHLCALNNVFNVSFHVSTQYANMNSQEKRKLLRNILAKLMYSCFRILWVIIVDDAEFTDKKSLSLLNTLARQDLVLFVMSFGQKRAIDYELTSVVRKRAQVINLQGLDKWYHAGLACQILNVEAIPAEVEKIIQEKSLGNPGWIESYLISLIQVEGLVIRKITEEESNTMGLVAPPCSMLRRSSKPIFEKSESRDDGWNMYELSYRDSRIKIVEQNKLISSDNEDDYIYTISICMISPNFTLEDFDTEATVDLIILRVFDALSIFEQFLLKCASVLGEIIDRKILEILMQTTSSSRKIALAIKRLFELRILGCAMGNFNRNSGPITLYGSMRYSDIEKKIHCGCIGITIQEDLLDLPKYASCGLMRFKMSVFRQVTYKLLTEIQKVEFHNKALHYLQCNTRRCVACGKRLFRKLLGKSNIVTDTEEQQLWKTNDFVVESLHSVNLNQTSITTIQSSRRSICSFSEVDFTNCECNLILITAYTQIVEHCRNIDGSNVLGINAKSLKNLCKFIYKYTFIKMLYSQSYKSVSLNTLKDIILSNEEERSDIALSAILEFAEICLSTCNILQARKLLQNGEEILDQIYNSHEGSLYDNKHLILSHIKAKIQILQGRCCLENSLINAAQNYFESALKTLNYNFPTNKFMTGLKTAILLEEQKIILAFYKRDKINFDEDNTTKFCDRFANCLAQMFIVFKINDMKECACLAAVWSFNTVVTSSKDFLIICTAYANMINALTIYNSKHRSTVTKLEENAINICYQKKDDLEFQEVKVIAELYFCIFLSRWYRGLILEAANIGFIAARLAHTVRFVSLHLNILQGLIQLLMAERRYSEVVTMLRELEFIAYEDVDKSGRVWYYALCIDMLLEAGIAVIPIQKCEQFYQEERHVLINMRDPEAEKRYFTCMWLWNVRICEWEAAAEWQHRLINIQIASKENSITAAITALKKLEILLIYFVHKRDCRNVKAVDMIVVEIKAQFKKILSMKKVVKVVYARYMFMKAYYEIIRNHNKSGFKLLQKTKKIATQLGDKMIYEWADHCQKMWNNSVSEIHYDLWKKRCTVASAINWCDLDKDNTLIFPYTLPLPKGTRGVLIRGC